MTQGKLLEAALFMSSRPLMLNDLSKILGVNSLGYVKEMLEKMQKEYENKGIEIVNTPQGWMMQVKPELLGKVAHLTPYADISEGSKRALAVIAYKEPVQQSEIIKIQGNKAYTYLKDLQKRNLIRMEKKGRTKEITLTGEFERYFGEEKEKLKARLESSQKKDSPKAEKTEKRKKKPDVAKEPGEQKEGGKSEEKSESLPSEKKSDITHILD